MFHHAGQCVYPRLMRNARCACCVCVCLCVCVFVCVCVCVRRGVCGLSSAIPHSAIRTPPPHQLPQWTGPAVPCDRPPNSVQP
jgi:hypothetical protein